MAEKIIQFTLRGIAPGLLMHKFPLVDIPGFDKLSKEEKAEHTAYRDTTGNLCIPAINLQRALVAGAAYSKGRGRASLQKPVAACIQVEPQHLDLGAKDYVIDARPVTIPATKGRIIRYRACLLSWSVDCEIAYDPELLTGDQLRTVVDDTGKRVGILDFRPECKGPFGRFTVVSQS